MRKLRRNQSGRNARSEVPQLQLILYNSRQGGLVFITITTGSQDQSRNTALLSETVHRSNNYVT